MAQVERARTRTGTVISIPFCCEVEDDDENSPIFFFGVVWVCLERREGSSSYVCSIGIR